MMSDDGIDLNATYTVPQTLPPLDFGYRHEREPTDHVVNIPITPRDDNVVTAQDKSHRRRKSTDRHKKKKQQSKDKERILISNPESDASTGTYVLSTAPQDSEPNKHVFELQQTPPPKQQRFDQIPKPVVLEPPLEASLTSIRRRSDVSRRGKDEVREEEVKTKIFLRKKRSRREKERDIELIMAEHDIRNFITSNFHQTWDPSAAGDTLDGNTFTSHTARTSKGLPTTNAFGRINFRKAAKSSYEPPYVRLHTDDCKDSLLELMSEHWKLPDPKLIVSIVGGAKRFQFAKSRISSLFKHGLMDIAKTTGAWILTPGSNTGVYKMIGSAVKDHIDSAGSAAMNELVLLGIASWGSVAGRDLLEDPEGHGKNPANYPITEISGKKGTQPLDPNHSHFILVDDGSRDKFGGEIKWRADFEKFLTKHVLCEQKAGDEVHIPMVTLLVNGGEGSLQACSESLSVGIPLVTIAGSGRAAEVIVLLHNLYNRHSKKVNWRPSEDELIDIYSKAMGTVPKEKVVKWLTIISTHHNLISVFDFIQPGTKTVDEIGLDRAILSALYPKDLMSSDDIDMAATISKRKAQMRLALSWDRVDYARDNIFNANNPDYKEFMRQKQFLCDVAVEALVEDMPEFMSLLIENGLDLDKFVTTENLEKLYVKSMQRDEAYSRMVKRYYDDQRKSVKTRCRGCIGAAVDPNTEYMHNIGRMIKKLLGYSYPNIYKVDNEVLQQIEKNFKDPRFNNPPQHLFIWATIFNRMELATMFWKYSQDHIAGAIVGAALLRGLAKESNDQEGVDIQATYVTNSLKFESLANGILDCCWAKDRQYTSDMLVREATNWGNCTVLSMAYNAEMEEFLAQPACYSKLNKIWRGDISLQTSLWRIYLFAFIPFLVPLLKFVRKRDCDPRMDERQSDPADLADLTKNDDQDTSPVSLRPLITVKLRGKTEKEISYFKAMYRAFTAPITKCIHYSIFFISFLLIYSLFLMTELQPFAETPGNATDSCGICCVGTATSRLGCLEIVTYGCALAMFVEEIRQVLFRDSRPIKYARQKIQDWLVDFWNQVDVLSYCLFITAITLRCTLSPYWFEWARILFCFSLMIYFIRFSQIFFVVEQLGPKIIMIKKMMVDLIFFLVILSMTVLAFGVICHSILNPMSPLSWNLIKDVIYRPYFQMYGELFLEDGFQDGYRWVLLGVYMILTNILLLNLLIAMFSYTFEQVQEKSEILWKFNYYAVVYEHFDRPYIPLIGTLVQMFRNCYSCRCCNLLGSHQNTDFRRKLEDETNRKITKFVKVCMEKYMSLQARLKSEDITHKVTNTARRLELVIEQLDDLRDDVVNQKLPDNSHSYQQVSIESSRSSNHHSQKQYQSLESKFEVKFQALNSLQSRLESKLDSLDKLDGKLDTIIELMGADRSASPPLLPPRTPRLQEPLLPNLRAQSNQVD